MCVGRSFSSASKEVVMPSRVDFVRGQGFTTEGCQDGLYSALMFQPRVIAGSSDRGRRPAEPMALPGAVISVVVERACSTPQPVRRILQPRDGGPDAARRHAHGAPAETILAGHGRHGCHGGRHDALRQSVRRRLAHRGRVRRRDDERRRPPRLPTGLHLPLLWTRTPATPCPSQFRRGQGVARHSTRVSLRVKGLGNGPFWLRCCVSHIVSPSSRYE